MSHGVRLPKPEGLTQEGLKKRFSYDPETGRMEMDGRQVGLFPRKRPQITLDGVRITATRIIWFYMKGEWPMHTIDHRDTDTQNSRWDNLRKATHGQNQLNRKVQKNKVSRYRGVRTKHGKWFCYVIFNRESHDGGYFENEVDAALRRDELARAHLPPEFARFNFPREGEKSVFVAG